MKSITIRELRLQTGHWVRHAATKGTVVITDRGHRIAAPEFVCALHRHMREGHVTAREARSVLDDLGVDEESGAWHWLPVSSALLRTVSDRVNRLPRTVSLRAGDALHATAAVEHGFGEMYTSDRHLLAACRHFGLRGIDVINSP